MNVIRTYIHIGVKEPFCVLHAGDTHLTFCDDRNDERKQNLAKNRQKYFPTAEEDLEFIKNKALSENRTVIYTGDMIDFVSEKNIEKVKEFTSAVDCFVCAGNHEFSLYVGEAKEDTAYRNQSLDKIQSAFHNNIRMSSRIIGGVNFVAIDNSYYRFDEDQLSFLKNEAEKEFPIILVVHVPLFSKEFYEYERDGKIGAPAYLMSVPEHLMKDYSPDRYEQQKEDEITAQAFSFITENKNIRAVISGHIHDNLEGEVAENLYQIATGLSSIREIYID